MFSFNPDTIWRLRICIFKKLSSSFLIHWWSRSFGLYVRGGGVEPITWQKWKEKMSVKVTWKGCERKIYQKQINVWMQSWMRTKKVLKHTGCTGRKNCDVERWRIRKLRIKLPTKHVQNINTYVEQTERLVTILLFYFWGFIYNPVSEQFLKLSARHARVTFIIN